MCAKKKRYLLKEKKIEHTIFNSLKYYGFLFPENVEDVDRFEELYGDTDVDIPEHLQSLESLQLNENNPLDFDFSNNMAAFSTNEPNQFTLPLDLDKEEGLDNNDI